MKFLLSMLTTTIHSAAAFTSFHNKNAGYLNSSYNLNASNAPNNAIEEAERLRQQAAKIREQLAELEGKSLTQVEDEAQREKDSRIEREKIMAAEAKARRSSSSRTTRGNNAILYVPETIEEQTRQAALSIERAFQDGITRQTVRLALESVQDGNARITPAEDENVWPGGAQQMYREAGRPMTEFLLKEIRAPALNLQTDEEKKSGKEAYPPQVIAQDIWDFDGTGIITAEAASGPSADVQAMVFPNTDVKYLKDIGKIHESFGKDRLFLLVNPFWKNVESWGFNILAPNAKKIAQEKVFDCEGGGFQETYVLNRFSVRGEDCVALKCYGYDWEMFAYIEDYSYGYGGPTLTSVRLGSSKEEPKSSTFTKLLNEREEFKMNKSMRQLRRNL